MKYFYILGFYSITLSGVLFAQYGAEDSSIPTSQFPSSHVDKSAKWSSYYSKTADAATPRHTLTKALEKFDDAGSGPAFAVDLGCGTGRDTLHLLKDGWSVLAMDAEKEAIEILLERTDENLIPFLDINVASFDEITLPENVDLINASMSLPFCNPETFPLVWKEITASLRPGGRFSGHFFGDRDAWAKIPGRTHHSYAEVLELFSEQFEIEYFEQIERVSPTAAGPDKKWHVFHVVARKLDIDAG